MEDQKISGVILHAGRYEDMYLAGFPLTFPEEVTCTEEALTILASAIYKTFEEFKEYTGLQKWSTDHLIEGYIANFLKATNDEFSQYHGYDVLEEELGFSTYLTEGTYLVITDADRAIPYWKLYTALPDSCELSLVEISSAKEVTL